MFNFSNKSGQRIFFDWSSLYFFINIKKKTGGNICSSVLYVPLIGFERLCLDTFFLEITGVKFPTLASQLHSSSTKIGSTEYFCWRKPS